MIPIRLSIKKQDFESLTAWLLQKDGLERQCFLEMGLNRQGHQLELLMHRVVVVPDHAYTFQNSHRVRPDDRFVVQAYQSFLKAGYWCTATCTHILSVPGQRSVAWTSLRAAPP